MPTTDDVRSQRLHHGTRANLKPGDLIEPPHPADVGEQHGMTVHVHLTPDLDAAIWRHVFGVTPASQVPSSTGGSLTTA